MKSKQRRQEDYIVLISWGLAGRTAVRAHETTPPALIAVEKVQPRPRKGQGANSNAASHTNQDGPGTGSPPMGMFSAEPSRRKRWDELAADCACESVSTPIQGLPSVDAPVNSSRSGTWEPTRARHAAQQSFSSLSSVMISFIFFRTPSLSGGGTPMDLQTGWRKPSGML